jgi:hypothetical protein
MSGRALKIDPRKSIQRGDFAEEKPPEPVDEKTIAALAHQLWIERGCPIGSQEEDWFNAESALKRQSK